MGSGHWRPLQALLESCLPHQGPDLSVLQCFSNLQLASENSDDQCAAADFKLSNLSLRLVRQPEESIELHGFPVPAPVVVSSSPH